MVEESCRSMLLMEYSRSQLRYQFSSPKSRFVGVYWKSSISGVQLLSHSVENKNQNYGPLVTNEAN